jgi:hypothetical protein
LGGRDRLFRQPDAVMPTRAASAPDETVAKPASRMNWRLVLHRGRFIPPSSIGRATVPASHPSSPAERKRFYRPLA